MRKQTIPFRLIATGALFTLTLLGALFWTFRTDNQGSVYAASKAIQPEYNLFPNGHSEESARLLFENDLNIESRFSEMRSDFIQAVPLAHGESSRWEAAGCQQETCAHLLYYNLSDKGTLEGVVNLDSGTVVDVWENEAARPLASSRTLEQAVEIANLDKRVTSVLGEVSSDDLMMVPMNIWLLDDACVDDWCVDLTFHDPAGSGKIFHVTVNMEEDAVARTFYTRNRPTLPYRDITPQRNAFTNDCLDNNGWSICWEMTAHDGIEFYDASYNGNTVFSSAKITQVEVWYPSWPGGYRDEIGFQATVPPYFDTVVEEVEDGVRISQLFTEFTRWPNCICCYRYEQVMVLFNDGSFNAEFVSHGPGCDDLSIYQPLWRFDLDLKDPGNDAVYVWREDAWIEQLQEGEIELVLDDDLSLDGEKVATFDGELHYRWSYEASDPLGVDEAKMFFVSQSPGEGDGPVLTGAANTFSPPRQWINGDPFSGSNITMWYVPLMKTKKGGPWYCMPEPAPDGTPCTSVLRAEPGGDLPSPEEIAAQLAELEETEADTATELAQAEPATATPFPTLAPTSTPATLEGEDPETLLINSGCGSCHVIGPLGEAGKVGPSLSNIGEIAESRGAELGQHPIEYIRRSILYPNEYVVQECPNGPCLDNVMPAYYGERLNANQLETMVAYLNALGGETNGQPQPIAANSEASSATAADGALTQPNQSANDLGDIISIMLLLVGVLAILVIVLVLVLPRIRARNEGG